MSLLFKYILFRYKLFKYNQKYLLNYYKKMDYIHKFNIINQVNSISWKECINALYSSENSNIKKNISPINYKDINNFDKKEKNKIIEIGEKNIHKYGVLLLAGGQGSRLGFNGPKGIYRLNIENGETFFSLYIKNIISFEKKYNVTIPIYIMASTENYNKTKEYFDENNYFNKNDSIILFKQENSPVFDINKRLIVVNNNILMASSGHGNVFHSMKKNGIFKDLKNRKIKWLLVTGIDNILMKPVDLFSLGLIVKNKSDSIGKSITKITPDEKMGIFCKINNKIGVVEYSESNNIKMLKNKNGNLLYNDGHLLWNIYDISKIKKIVNKKVKYHIAIKRINNEGYNIIGYKMEKFIFDYFRFFNNFIILRVNRNEEFAPIKNKVGNDCPKKAYELYNSYNKNNTN